jgi:hypothetical protein
MQAGRVELFVNVMWRELDRPIQQRPEAGTPHAQTLDDISDRADELPGRKFGAAANSVLRLAKPKI